MTWKFVKLQDSSKNETARRKTSDSLAGKAKQFLEKIDVRLEIVKKQTLEIIRNIKDFRLPEKHEQVRVRTQSQINLISLVMLIVHERKVIDELTIATYTLNKEAFAILRSLLESGKIKKLNLLIASSYSFRDKDYFAFLKTKCLELSEKYHLKLIFAWLHFKITLARCGDDFYQFEGSMNYSTNNMAEQILLCNSREVYEYDYALLTDFYKKLNNKSTEVVC